MVVIVMEIQQPITIKRPRKISVTERNLQSAAARLLPKTKKLVSTEIAYIQRVLGRTATQQDIDEKVVAVRKMPWSSLIGD